MDTQRWIARQEANWRRLDSLLRQVETKGIRSLNARSLKQLASLYRAVSADLARALTYQVGKTIIRDLQGLVSRSFSLIYQGSRRQEWQAAVNFYRWGFPALMRQTLPYTLLAVGIFALGGVIAWYFASTDPQFLPLILPTELISKVRDRGELWMGSIVGVEPLASTQIMTNNLSVSFAAAGGGMLAGLGTIYILFFNGLMIGSVGALVDQGRLAYPFWAFVFPHGSLELPAIFLAGAAGLLLARGLLFPAPYRRVDALRLYGSQAVQLIFGVVPMLVMAGTIEGFFSPSPLIPEPFKYLAGILLFWGLIVYAKRKPVA